MMLESSGRVHLEMNLSRVGLLDNRKTFFLFIFQLFFLTWSPSMATYFIFFIVFNPL